MSDLIEIEIDSLNTYLSQIERITGIWGIHYADIWYRGVASQSYELVPRVIWNNHDNENSMVEEFMLYYESYYGKTIDEPWQLYCLMQHYGLPTRLLDWTRLPIIALFFALLESVTDDKNIRVVWMMSPLKLNSLCHKEKVVYTLSNHKINSYLPKSLSIRTNVIEYDSEAPVALQTPYVNKRMISQQGCFTVHGKSKRNRIDEYFVGSDSDYIVKFIINETNKKKLQKSIYLIGYREDDIFQDLDSLSKRIVREFTYSDVK